MFLLLKLGSLQKIINIFVFILIQGIFTQFWSTLGKGNKDRCDLKETFVFFLKFIKKLAHAVLKFFIIIENMC